jgi:hypothetical protein
MAPHSTEHRHTVMSCNSKAKRDQRKKQQPRRPFARLGRAPDVQNHAVMQDAEGRVIAAIGLQGDEGCWPSAARPWAMPTTRCRCWPCSSIWPTCRRRKATLSP